MANYTAHNLGVLQRRMGSRLGSTGSAVAVEIFTEVAKSVFAWLNTQTKYKNHTKQLSSSIGVGVYENGVFVKWINNPEQIGTKNKTYIYHGVSYTVDGRKELEKAINAAAGTTIGGYSMIIFCAIPYGAWVELGLGTQRTDGTTKQGVGWWSEGLIPHAKATFAAQCNKYKIPVRYGRT